MPAIRTFARPVNDSVTVHIPEEYRSYSFKVLLVPVSEAEEIDRKPQPSCKHRGNSVTTP